MTRIAAATALALLLLATTGRVARAAPAPAPAPAPATTTATTTSAAKPLRAAQIEIEVRSQGKDEKSRIRDMAMGSRGVLSYTPGDPASRVLRISGKYARASGADRWSLVLTSRPITVRSNGAFEVVVPLGEEEGDEVELLAIGPLGEVEREKFRFAAIGGGALPGSAVRRHFYSAAMGLSLISYQEEGLPDLSEIALTAKGTYRFVIKPEVWDVALNGFVTALPVSASVPEMQARFAGANLRVGHRISLVKSPWTLILSAGGYYTTMLNSDFGFSDLMGPQIFPTLRRDLKDGKSSIGGYFKFSPVGSGLGLSTLSDREVAFGADYRRRLANGRLLTVSLDIAQLALLIDGTAFSSNSTTVSIGYGF